MSNKECKCQIPNTDLAGRCFKCGGSIMFPPSNSTNTQLPAGKCPECGGLNGGHSNRRCSLMPLEYAQQEIINVEQKWIKVNSEQSKHFCNARDRLIKSVSAAQGKIAVLKHENNKLRKNATAYATKLHQVEQENKELRGDIQVRDEDIVSYKKENEEAKDAAVMFCNKYNVLATNHADAIDLLKEVFQKHGAMILMHDPVTYEEIKKLTNGE